MPVLKCTMCGGDLEINSDITVGICQYCGSTLTIPRQLDKLGNLFNRANALRQNNEFDKAILAYEDILREDYDDAEAHWGLVLCKYGIEYVEDPQSGERVPTCHRLQYDSILLDPDYQAALKSADAASRVVYESAANRIDRIQKRILEIAAKEEPFDVFICYKESDDSGSRSEDSVYAQEMYYELTKRGYKVFYARKTLDGKLGQAYEPIIFAALNSARAMVVLGTRPENFNAVWVKNEWSRYRELIKKGQAKTMIPAYRGFSAYELPVEFANLQALDMAKLGFMHDLIDGLEKILKLNTAPKPAAPETKSIVNGNSATQPLLDRAYLCLEDGDFSKADDLVEQVLNLDPRSAQAYVAKLMVELHVTHEANLASSARPLTESNNYQKAIRFADDTYKQTLEGYNQVILDRLEEARKESLYQAAKSQQGRSSSETDYQTAARMYREITGYKDADERAVECDQRVDKARVAREKAEEEARIRAEETRLRDEQIRLEKERQRQAANEKRKRLVRKAMIIGPIVVVLVVILALLINLVIIPANKYAKAQELLANKQYDEAIALFYELGDYKDSAEQPTEEIKRQILASPQVGQLVYWGQYEQDNNTGNGKEDIAWKVLAISEGKALLISEKNLDCQPYNISNEAVTWATCSLRGWLNTTFISEAFTAEDQSRIVDTDLINDDNSEYGTRGGDPTKDKIFLLSIAEAKQYFPDDRARVGTNTSYAVSRGAYDNGGNGWWWLRSPGHYGIYAAYVNSNGDVREYGNSVNIDINAVRPAFWINLPS